MATNGSRSQKHLGTDRSHVRAITTNFKEGPWAKTTKCRDLPLFRVFALGALLSIALSYSASSLSASDVAPSGDTIRDNARKSAKAYGVGGALDISGAVNYSISNTNRTVSATVEKIRNDSSTTTSGSLKLMLFVTTGPITGPFTYWIVGEQPLDPLLAQLCLQQSFGHRAAQQCARWDVLHPHTASSNSRARAAAVRGTASMTGLPSHPVCRSLSGIYSLAFAISVEYFHTTFGHYFVSGLAEEIAALDSGAFAGWVRTGLTFNVWSVPGGARVPVCRFFTTAFAPRSSHFYTPFANECAIVQGNPVWQYEGIVAYIDLPNAAGACAIGIPLYRLYNNGMSGAPNHRYTTSMATRLQMIAQGWIPEGAGSLGVIGCVPS